MGRSQTPKNRLAVHARGAAAFGVTAGRRWVSRPICDASEAEAELIKRCSALAPPAHGREFFPLSWDLVLAEAEAIDLGRHDTEARERAANRVPLFGPMSDIFAAIQEVDGIANVEPGDVALMLRDLRDATASADDARADDIYGTLTTLRTDWRLAALLFGILSANLTAAELRELAYRDIAGAAR